MHLSPCCSSPIHLRVADRRGRFTASSRAVGHATVKGASLTATLACADIVGGTLAPPWVHIAPAVIDRLVATSSGAPSAELHFTAHPACTCLHPTWEGGRGGGQHTLQRCCLEVRMGHGMAWQLLDLPIERRALRLPVRRRRSGSLSVTVLSSSSYSDSCFLAAPILQIIRVSHACASSCDVPSAEYAVAPAA